MVLVVRFLLLCVCSRDVLAPAVLRPLRVLPDPVHGPRHPREHRGEVLNVAPGAVHLRHEAGHPDHGLSGQLDISSISSVNINLFTPAVLLHEYRSP